MLLGVPEIDNQHRTLIDALNQFVEACSLGKGRNQIEQTLNYLVSYTQNHFRDEERIQKQCAYPDANTHMLIHSQFIVQISALMKKFRQTGPTVVLVGELNKTMTDWVVNHITTEDKKIGEHILKTNG